MNILDQFKSLSIESLEDYIKNQQEENLYLEFKAINKANLTNKDDKKNLAKALSGYANSSGGSMQERIQNKLIVRLIQN